jgi:hypothetical protein
MRHPRPQSSVPVDGDRTPAGVEGVELQARDRTVVGVDVARRSDEHQRPCTHRAWCELNKTSRMHKVGQGSGKQAMAHKCSRSDRPATAQAKAR